MGPCVAYCLCSRVGSVAVAVPAPTICFAPLSIVTAASIHAFMVQAVTTFVKFMYHKRMGQDCKTQCVMTTLFTWEDGHDAQHGNLPPNSRCPKCTVLPYLAATLRSYVRAWYDEVRSASLVSTSGSQAQSVHKHSHRICTSPSVYEMLPAYVCAIICCSDVHLTASDLVQMCTNLLGGRSMQLGSGHYAPRDDGPGGGVDGAYSSPP